VGLFDNVFMSCIRGNEKRRFRKNIAKTVLFVVANPSTSLARKGGSLDLSPFTVPAEQVYRLSTEIDCECFV
jgi:hypothetical protein